VCHVRTGWPRRGEVTARTAAPHPTRRRERGLLGKQAMSNQDMYTESGNHHGQVIGERVAQQLAGISDRVRESSDQIANRLDEAAGYLRGRSGRDFASDLGGVIRRNPWQTAIGVGLAFLAFRMLRR
jgi:hypothetical protein